MKMFDVEISQWKWQSHVVVSIVLDDVDNGLCYDILSLTLLVPHMGSGAL